MGRFADGGAHSPIIHSLISALFVVCLFVCPPALAANNGVRYSVVYNGKLIEEHIYNDGHLQSIISYGLTGKRDSFVLDSKRGVVEYSQTKTGYEVNANSVYARYFEPDFESSLQSCSLFNLLDNGILLEDIIYGVMQLDSMLFPDMKYGYEKRTMTKAGNTVCIRYGTLFSEIGLPAVSFLQPFEYTPLKSVEIKVKRGRLRKIHLTGSEAKVSVCLKYRNGILAEKRIKYWRGQKDIYKYYAK